MVKPRKYVEYQTELDTNRIVSGKWEYTFIEEKISSDKSPSLESILWIVLSDGGWELISVLHPSSESEISSDRREFWFKRPVDWKKYIKGRGLVPQSIFRGERRKLEELREGS